MSAESTKTRALQTFAKIERLAMCLFIELKAGKSVSEERKASGILQIGITIDKPDRS